MIYDIRLALSYTYPNAATTGRHLLHMFPADLPGVQRTLSGHIVVEPEPVEWYEGQDFFGNRTVEVAFDTPHPENHFEMNVRVERSEGDRVLDLSPRLEELAGDVAGIGSLAPSAPHHFLGPSPRVVTHPAMTAYAAKAGRDGETVLEILRAVGRMIHEDFTFDPEATEVDTPTLDAFERRQGVCQDFAHVMISCLRGIGIPAGYVSGFLRTVPPRGEARLEGADATHAWVRAWCGARMGWVEYDPTNALDVAADHVVVAYGRDYSDVAPVKGVMRLAGAQQASQAVDVIPHDGR